MLETIRQSNLAQLESRYFCSHAAESGGSLIDRNAARRLRTLLRSHLLEPISEAEADSRDNVDALLSYYSLLEIGALAGCLPDPLPKNLAEAAHHRLSQPSVRRYYESFYPLVLPQLFRRRTAGEPSPDGSTIDSHHFMTFLQISELASGEPVDSFLWFLDEGQSEDSNGTWWSLADFLQTISDKRSLVRHMTRPSKKWGPLERSLHGFVRFLNFMRTFDSFLQSCPRPLLRSAFWHHHAYWFEQLGGQVGGVISVAIEQYRSWVGKSASPREQELIQYTNKDMDEAQWALRRLTSGLYRAPLDELALETAQHAPSLAAEVEFSQSAAGLGSAEIERNTVRIAERLELLIPEFSSFESNKITFDGLRGAQRYGRLAPERRTLLRAYAAQKMRRTIWDLVEAQKLLSDLEFIAAEKDEEVVRAFPPPPKS